jgi:DNA-binding transcriptional ArsR family regulator
MANHESTQFDAVFSALSDPTRRAILSRLEKESCVTVTRLAEPFAIKLPAVMKHLGILLDVGLIVREKRGRTVEVRLRADPLRDVTEWLKRYEKFWSDRLDRLADYAEHQERLSIADPETSD